MKIKLMIALTILVTASLGFAKTAKAMAKVYCAPQTSLNTVSTIFQGYAHAFINGTKDGQSCVIRFMALSPCPATLPATGVSMPCKGNSARQANAISSMGQITVVPPAAFQVWMNQNGHTSTEIINAFGGGMNAMSTLQPTAQGGIPSAILNNLKTLGTVQ